MKKFAVLLLALSLVCGALTGCASDKGNIDDTDGVVTDSPRDDDDSIIDDDMGDGKIGDKDKDKDKDNKDNNGSTNSSGSTDNSGSSGNTSSTGNSGGNNDAPVPTSIPGNSTTATQPVTP